MREPVPREASGEGVSGAVGEAARRLDLAVALLESSLAERPGEIRAAEPAAALLDAQDRITELEGERDALTAQIRSAAERERELEAAATAASEALGRAAAEVRAALAEIPSEEEAA